MLLADWLAFSLLLCTGKHAKCGFGLSHAKARPQRANLDAVRMSVPEMPVRECSTAISVASN
jgi:hypothetical protein